MSSTEVDAVLKIRQFGHPRSQLSIENSRLSKSRALQMPDKVSNKLTSRELIKFYKKCLW